MSFDFPPESDQPVGDDDDGSLGDPAKQDRFEVASIRGPNSWLAPAIVATLCCFAPTGMVALFFASRVGVYWELGDRSTATAKARAARAWVLISFALWIVTMTFLVATGRAGRFLEAGVL